MKKDKVLVKAVDKFELVATSNNGYRHKYVCVKKESFKKSFIKFMIALGFEEKKIKDRFIGYEEKFDKDGEPYDVPKPIKIKEMTDVLDYFQNKKYDIEVFYGFKKIFILVRVKGREDLVENIIDKSYWKKFPKIFPKEDYISNKQKLKPVKLVNRRRRELE